MRTVLIFFAVLCGLLTAIVGCSNGVDNSKNGQATKNIFGIDDQTKEALLKEYAPRVWFHSEERFWPSSVEWSFNFLKRQWDPKSKHWWLITKENLKEPSSVLKYFHGCDPIQQWTEIPCQLDNVPAYAFWHKRSSFMEFMMKLPFKGKEIGPSYDLLYYFYYPYNRGKEKMNTVWSNHVGDWEHVTVRLTWQKVSDKWILAPISRGNSFYLAYHNKGVKTTWPPTLVPDTHHPIVYAAKDSHGSYLAAGSHTYESSALIGDLTDHTNKGTAWDTWKTLECFDYDTKRGLGPTWKGTWPTWLEKDTGDRNVGNEDPASGPVYRWGNQRAGKEYVPKNWNPFKKEFWSPTYEYRLVDGPTGPADKNYLTTSELD